MCAKLLVYRGQVATRGGDSVHAQGHELIDRRPENIENFFRIGFDDVLRAYVPGDRKLHREIPAIDMRDITGKPSECRVEHNDADHCSMNRVAAECRAMPHLRAFALEPPEP